MNVHEVSVESEDFDDWWQVFGSDSAGTTAADPGGAGRGAWRLPQQQGRRRDPAGSSGAVGSELQADGSAGGSAARADDTEGTASMGCQSAGPSGRAAGAGRSSARGPRGRSGGSGGALPSGETAQQRAHRLFYERKKERVSGPRRRRAGKGRGARSVWLSVHFTGAGSGSFPRVTNRCYDPAPGVQAQSPLR
jgi:hypothetical protein